MMIADRHSPLVYGAAVAAKDSFATTWLMRPNYLLHGFQPWLHSFAAAAAGQPSMLSPLPSRGMASLEIGSIPSQSP